MKTSFTRRTSGILLLIGLFLMSCSEKQEIIRPVVADNYVSGFINGEPFRFADGNWGYSMSHYSPLVYTGADIFQSAGFNGDISGLQVTRLGNDMQKAIRFNLKETDLHTWTYPHTFTSETHDLNIQWIDWQEERLCPYIMPEDGTLLKAEVTITHWDEHHHIEGTFKTLAGEPIELAGSFVVRALLAQ